MALPVVLGAVLFSHGQGTNENFPSRESTDSQVVPVPDMPAPLSASTPTSSSQGNQLMQQATAQLLTHSSIKADIRQRVDLFGHTLVGSGAYHQISNDHSLLIRTDLKIQLEDRSATFQQIVDGRFLWNYQDSPDINELGKFRQQLSRVDLDTVRMAVPVDPASAASMTGLHVGFSHGGLPRLMDQLTSRFDFEAPKSGTFHDNAVWIAVGNWKPQALSAISKREGEEPPEFDFERALEKLPAQLPQSMTVVLGKVDLFPHRIEFRRRKSDSDTKNIVVTQRSKPILILDLFEVRVGVPINPDKFVRRAGNLPVIDVTEKYLVENGLTHVVP